MKRSLAGRVAIVTGASSGVGWQSARRLGERGARLCVTARRRDALERLRAELEAEGIDCLVAPGDVSKGADVKRVVARCLERFGRVDILVNAAAVQAYGTFEELDWEEITRVLDVTCLGYLRFARAVLPHFRRQGSGHVINVQSMLSVGAAPLLSSYTMAKHATLGWADCLRLELAGSGISVSNVLLPSVSTPMFLHAPTKLGRAPRPVPPTYDTDMAARAVVRCAHRPDPAKVPVFLQGRLILIAKSLVPRLGDFVLERWGEAMQTGEERIDRPRGNLFEPVPEGVGPYGNVPPTARWKRWAGTLAVVAGAALLPGGVALAAGLIGRRVRRRLASSGS